MLEDIPPDSELARELRKAEEAEKGDAERSRSELQKMTAEHPKASSRESKKPAPTPEMHTPSETKRVSRSNLAIMKLVENNKDKASPTKDSEKQTPTKKDVRAGLDKRMELAWGEEAICFFADASDNFARALLKLKEFAWEEIVDSVTQVREERVASAREAGKSFAQWLPIDVEQAAEGLGNPITSTKRASKRPASPTLSVSQSPSARETPSPSVEVENNRFKKRSELTPAVACMEA